jgi:hypothetical protein
MPVDPIGTLKNISEIVKKYNDLELMRQIVDLQSQVFELQQENLALKKERAERLDMQMRGPHGYYFKDGDEVPFCPKCWEGDGKPVHLPADIDYFGFHGRICRVCKQDYHEGPPPARPRQLGGSGRGTPWG